MKNLISANTTFKLSEILHDDELMSLFPKSYFPSFEKIDSKIFIKTINSDYSSLLPIMSKFIVINTNGKIDEDSIGEYVELPTSGYLLRLDFTKFYTLAHMSVKYICDINKIKIIANTTENTIFRTIDSADTINIAISLNIESREFFDKYININ